MILGIPQLPLGGRAPQNVAEWLEVATWNLVPSAKARVRPEIETHFGEAVQSRLATGLSASVAQSAALIDLGDAQAAARSFRREYLTAEDLEGFSAGIDRPGKTSQKAWCYYFLLNLLMLGISLFLGWACVPALRASALLYTVPIPICGLIYTSLGLATDNLRRRKPTLATVRRISLLRTIQNLGFFAVVMLNYLMMFTDPDAGQGVLKDMLPLYSSIKVSGGLFLVGLLVISLISAIRRELRLRKKLAAASEDDLPPLDTAST